MPALEVLARHELQAGFRGLVKDNRGGPVHQDPGVGAGPPAVLGRDARGEPGAAGGRGGGPRGGDGALVRPATSSVARDITNFATFIDTGNARAPIAQRGKAKQNRSGLRLVGLRLVGLAWWYPATAGSTQAYRPAAQPLGGEFIVYRPGAWLGRRR
jgi:hypothetical protein